MDLKHKLTRSLLAGGLALVLTTGVAFASIGTGTVTAGSSLRLRAKATTSSSTLAIAPYGAKVDVLEDAGNGWYKVQYNGMEGFMSGQWLSITLDGAEADETPAAPSADPQTPAETVSEAGYVNAGPLNVRSGPGTGYSRVGSLKQYASVTITEKQDGWYKITSGNVAGYVSAQYITLGAAPAQPLNEKAYVNAGPLNVRSGPGTSYGKVGSLSQYTAVTITEKQDGWYKITSGNTTGYVSAEYITLGSAPETAVSNAAGSSLGNKAASLAKSLVGCPYVYGAAGPRAFDCSGLTYYIYKSLGVNIARGSSSQYYNTGYFVKASLATMQPGDLLYFFDRAYDSSGGRLPTTHAGIYIGNNKFVHAATPSSGVCYGTLFGTYNGNHLVGVKRVG